MRSRLPLISALLALALLLGPALVAAHDDSDHGLQAGAAHCVVCVYAHSAGTGALPALPVIVIAGAVDPPEPVLAKSSATVTVRLHPIRGPPALLA